MPFGLSGAATSFQRVMDKALRRVRNCAITYIDDILVFTPSWETHLVHLKQVLSALHEVGLTASRKKSHHGYTSVQYLGFRIGGGRVRAVPNKVATLRQENLPQIKKELQRFIGLASYYCRFIPGFVS